MKLTVGIDPGLSGAYAVLDSDGVVIALDDMPVIRDGRLAWIDASVLLPRLLEAKAGRPMHAVVERQQAMPAQGRTSCVTIGLALGSLLAALQVAGCSIEFVSATTWKGALGLSRDKLSSLDKARLLFPLASLDRMKDHGRAESLLVTHWALARDRRAAA